MLIRCPLYNGIQERFHWFFSDFKGFLAIFFHYSDQRCLALYIWKVDYPHRRLCATYLDPIPSNSILLPFNLAQLLEVVSTRETSQPWILLEANIWDNELPLARSTDIPPLWDLKIGLVPYKALPTKADQATKLASWICSPLWDCQMLQEPVLSTIKLLSGSPNQFIGIRIFLTMLIFL